MWRVSEMHKIHLNEDDNKKGLEFYYLLCD